LESPAAIFPAVKKIEKVFMKSFQNLLGAVLCGAIIGLAASASAQDAEKGYATVVRVEGRASYTLGDGNWHPLVAGLRLAAGSQIRTGENGVVDVVLGRQIDLPQSQWLPEAKWRPEHISLAPDAPVRGMVTYKPAAEQNAVRLTQNTTLAFDKLNLTAAGTDVVSDTELDLKAGKIYASVKKFNALSQYTVKIPKGIAGVRGTLFSLTVDGAVAVFESHGGGLVLSLTLPDGSTKVYLVTPGELLDPVTGQPTPIPPELSRTLSDIFIALRTIYVQVANFDFDRTQVYVSPVHGNPPPSPR
jgi:hypothetical protein